MRLWTIHPKYLDSKGIVAAWREALLAQKVLAGGTKGYTHHPQLIRFQTHRTPLPAIAAFLSGLASEADHRGYHFDKSKISAPQFKGQIPETRGQLAYEWQHLKRKLRLRDPERYQEFRSLTLPDPHPLFHIIPGKVQSWEKTS